MELGSGGERGGRGGRRWMRIHLPDKSASLCQSMKSKSVQLQHVAGHDRGQVHLGDVQWGNE